MTPTLRLRPPTDFNPSQEPLASAATSTLDGPKNHLLLAAKVRTLRKSRCVHYFILGTDTVSIFATLSVAPIAEQYFRVRIGQEDRLR